MGSRKSNALLHDLKGQWYQILLLGAQGKFFTLILETVGYTEVFSAGWTADGGSLMCMDKGWLWRKWSILELLLCEESRGGWCWGTLANLALGKGTKRKREKDFAANLPQRQLRTVSWERINTVNFPLYSLKTDEYFKRGILVLDYTFPPHPQIQCLFTLKICVPYISLIQSCSGVETSLQDF